MILEQRRAILHLLLMVNLDGVTQIKKRYFDNLDCHCGMVKYINETGSMGILHSPLQIARPTKIG